MTGRHWLQATGAVWAGALLAWGTLWFLGRIAPTLWLFALGLMVAYVLDPLLDRLEARGWSRGRAVLAVTGGIVVVVLLLGAWMVPSLVNQAQSLAHHWPDYSASLDRLYGNLDRSVRAYAARRFPEYDVMPYLDDKVEAGRKWLESRLPQAVALVSDTLVRSVGLVGVLVMVAMVGYNFMLVIDPFRKALRDMLPAPAQGDVASISRQVSLMLGQYVRGQATMCVLMGLMCAALLFGLGLIFGTQYALIIGALAGLVYVVPWLGAFATNVAATAIGYLTASHDPGLSALCALGAMTLNNFLCDNIIGPRIIGRQVGLHPLVIIFALMAGYQVMGFAGMIIATPVAASVKIILARWLPLQPVEAAPGKPQPLLFDLAGGFRLARRGLEGMAQRFENAMGRDPDTPAPGGSSARNGHPVPNEHSTQKAKDVTPDDHSGPA
jgi:putative permease